MASVHGRSEEAQAEPDYAVLTPERVTLQYDVAGIGSRSAAALIDVSIQSAVLLVLGIALAIGGRLTGGTVAALRLARNDALPLAILAALFVLGLFVVLFGYYLFFEIVWNGQTPGKRVLGIRVLRENGYPLRAGDAVVRNLIRVLDGPPFGALIGLTVMLFNDRARRLGDFAAGTLVVREGTRRGVADLVTGGSPGGATPDGGAEAASANGAPVLRAGDSALLRDFLVRRNRLESGARARLATRLADTLAARYGLQARRAGEAPEVFLERLAGY